MVEYRIVKYCRLCKKRFVVPKAKAKVVYCEHCQERIEQSEQKEEKEKEENEH
jgi:hypothetical protein